MWTPHDYNQCTLAPLVEVVRWLSKSISIIICISKYPRSTCGGGEVVEHGPQPVLLPAQLLLQPLHPGELLNLGRSSKRRKGSHRQNIWTELFSLIHFTLTVSIWREGATKPWTGLPPRLDTLFSWKTTALVD